MSAGVRLTAGRFKGRRLPVLAKVRPTEGRVREALMSRWALDLPGARVLDLFAGSGAVAIESLGRGATSATLVDRGAAVIANLKRQLSALGDQLEPSSARVVRLELPSGLAKLVGGDPYDLIFADPPYAFGAYGELLGRAALLLGDEGELVIEHGDRLAEAATMEELVPETMELLETRRYGDCRLSFFRRPMLGQDAST